MSYETQCGLGFIFGAVFLILFFAVKFRNAGNEARTSSVALQAYGESHNYSVVAIMLLAVLTYAVLLDLVGNVLAIAAGCCVTALWCFAFLNLIGLPIRWDK